MQAIITKYIGPTNHRGSRIKAECEAGSITIPYDYGLDDVDLHLKAVNALIKKLDWNYNVLGHGSLPRKSPHSYCFILHYIKKDK